MNIMPDKVSFEVESNILDRFKNLEFLDVVLIIILIIFVVFNAKMVYLYEAKGSIPETYALAVVAALLGEAGMCSKIFTSKMKYKEKKLISDLLEKGYDIDQIDKLQRLDRISK